MAFVLVNYVSHSSGVVFFDHRLTDDSSFSPSFVIRHGLDSRKTIPMFRSLLSIIRKLCKCYLNTFEKSFKQEKQKQFIRLMKQINYQEVIVDFSMKK